MSDPTGLAPPPIPDTWLADPDRATLGHGQWYTDGVISAFQHYLVDFVVTPALQTNMFDTLKFVSPSEVTWFQQFAAEGDLITLLERDKYIFLPLNSTPVYNDNYATTGVDPGLHWSLLLLCTEFNEAIYFDSLPGDNGLHRAEVEAFRNRFPGAFNSTSRGVWKWAKATSNPRDATDTDCGPFVCWLMEAITLRLIHPYDEWDAASCPQGSPADAWKFDHTATAQAAGARLQIAEQFVRPTPFEALRPIRRPTVRAGMTWTIALLN